MPIHSDKKWRMIVDENERVFEQRIRRLKDKAKWRARQKHEKKEESSSSPKVWLTEERCQFSGCAFPSIFTAIDTHGQICVCRYHYRHLEMECGRMVDHGILRVLLESISEKKRWGRGSLITIEKAEDMYVRRNSRADAIIFDPSTGSRFVQKARSRVADRFIAKAKADSAIKKTDEWHDRLAKMPRNAKGEIDSVKNLAVGQSCRIPARFDDVFLSARKMRQALQTYRATMFSTWSVKAQSDGTILVTKTGGAGGASEYWRSAIQYHRANLESVKLDDTLDRARLAIKDDTRPTATPVINAEERAYSCDIKKGYLDMGSAVLALERLEGIGRWGMVAYACQFCDCWHIGHESRRPRQAALA